MPRTNRITYGQCLVLASPRPADQDNTANLTGMKRTQSAAVDFSFSRQRFKQIGTADFVGDVNLTNPEITLAMDYYYTNGTNEMLLGLNVDGAKGGALSGIRLPAQDNNFYVLLGSGVNDQALLTQKDADFKDNYTVTALGNCFLNSYSIGASVGSLAVVRAEVQADNISAEPYNNVAPGMAIPAIDLSTQKPSATNKYRIKKSFFKNTTNQDGLIPSAMAPSGIKLTLPNNVNVPGLEFTGANSRSAFINSFGLEFSIDRTALYGFGSIYPYGRRAILPVLGTLSFSATASEFQSGNLNDLVILDNNKEAFFDFTIDIMGASGITGARWEVEGARADSQSLSQSIGDNGGIDAQFSFSMSDASGLKFSTPPLIINHPTGSASSGATLEVQATGRTSTDSSVYNADGFKYQWYSLAPLAAVGTNQGSYATAATGNYYVVVSNELGESRSNISSVT
jgi:hypothetical protein